MSHYDEYYEQLAKESKVMLDEKREIELKRLTDNGIDKKIAEAILDNRRG